MLLLLLPALTSGLCGGWRRAAGAVMLVSCNTMHGGREAGNVMLYIARCAAAAEAARLVGGWTGCWAVLPGHDASGQMLPDRSGWSPDFWSGSWDSGPLSDPGLPRHPACHCRFRNEKLNLCVPSDVARASSPART